MEHRYYRDLKHSYVIVDVKDEAEDKNCRYQQKVLESKRVKRFLPCSLRQINNEQFLYYDVTSMMSMEDRFAVKKMNYGQVKGFLTDLKNMLMSMSEFLLGEEGIVFNMGSIFANLSSDEFNFMFFPYSDDNPKFSDFCEELLDFVDYEDEKASSLIYNLCDMIKEEGAMLLDVISSVISSDEEEESLETSVREESMDEQYSYDDAYEDDDYDEEYNQESVAGNRMKMSKAVLGGKIQLLFAFLFVAVIAAVTYVRMNFVLSDEENLLSMGVMLVSGVTGVIALLTGMRDIRKAREAFRGETVVKTDDLDDYDEDDYEENSENSYRNPIRITASFKEKEEERPVKKLPKCEETMVLTDEAEEGMTLYSRNLDKTVRIELDNLPVVIGKMEGCVDMIVSDPSVSRIHCKFVSEGDRVAVVDLGSTNGTFKNGVKLSPKDKNYIEEGDEIKIGRVCFDCR